MIHSDRIYIVREKPFRKKDTWYVTYKIDDLEKKGKIKKPSKRLSDLYFNGYPWAASYGEGCDYVGGATKEEAIANMITAEQLHKPEFRKPRVCLYQDDLDKFLDDVFDVLNNDEQKEKISNSYHENISRCS